METTTVNPIIIDYSTSLYEETGGIWFVFKQYSYQVYDCFIIHDPLHIPIKFVVMNQPIPLIGVGYLIWATTPSEIDLDTQGVYIGKETVYIGSTLSSHYGGVSIYNPYRTATLKNN